MNDVQEVSEVDGVADLDEREVLRQSIEHHEAELREAVEELTAAVKSEVSLAGQITEHPWIWLAGGFVFGLMLSRR